jgi:hypothetical protein
MEHWEDEPQEEVQQEAPTDHKMNQTELNAMQIEKKEVYLLGIIAEMEKHQFPVPEAMREQLRDIQLERGFVNYIASIEDPAERQEALERAKVEGIPDEFFEPLTPPDDFFVEGNGTIQ